MIAMKLGALAFVLVLTAIGIFVVRRNLRGESTFPAVAYLGLRPPIWLELAGNSIFLVVCGFFLVGLMVSLFEGS